MRNHEPFPSFSLSLSVPALLSLSLSLSPRHSPSLLFSLRSTLSHVFPSTTFSLPFSIPLRVYTCTRICPQRVRTYVCTWRAWRPPCGVFPSSSLVSLYAFLAAKTNRKDGFCFRRNRPVISEKSMGTRRVRCFPSSPSGRGQRIM